MIVNNAAINLSCLAIFVEAAWSAREFISLCLHQFSDILRASGASCLLTKCVLDVLTKLWWMLGSCCMRWVLVTWGLVTCHTGRCQQTPGPGNHWCCCNWCELLLWRWATTAAATAARPGGIRNRTRPVTAERPVLSLSALNQLQPNTRPRAGESSREPWAILCWCHAQWTRRPICVFWLFSKLLELFTIWQTRV